MKDSFILYNSFYEPIKSLKNEQLGKLLRSIFDYTINGEITKDTEILVAFMFIKNQIDLDSKKWEQEREKRSEAGKKGMQSRWNNKDNKVITTNNKNNNVINDITKITDNVNDNVNVKENIKRKVFEKPSIDDIQSYCEERNNGINANAFYDFYESKNWMVGKNKMKDWKACIRTWEQRQPKKDIPDLPKWFNQQYKEQEMDDERKRELEELIRGY